MWLEAWRDAMELTADTGGADVIGFSFGGHGGAVDIGGISLSDFRHVSGARDGARGCFGETSADGICSGNWAGAGGEERGSGHCETEGFEELAALNARRLLSDLLEMGWGGHAEFFDIGDEKDVADVARDHEADWFGDEDGYEAPGIVAASAELPSLDNNDTRQRKETSPVMPRKLKGEWSDASKADTASWETKFAGEHLACDKLVAHELGEGSFSPVRLGSNSDGRHYRRWERAWLPVFSRSHKTWHFTRWRRAELLWEIAGRCRLRQLELETFRLRANSGTEKEAFLAWRAVVGRYMLDLVPFGLRASSGTLKAAFLAWRAIVEGCRSKYMEFDTFRLHANGGTTRAAFKAWRVTRRRLKHLVFDAFRLRATSGAVRRAVRAWRVIAVSGRAEHLEFSALRRVAANGIARAASKAWRVTWCWSTQS
eukprot:TRINITY_DN31836_c0_g1_i1.p1 TRINITY_DN31836_c0_g1~~TRINITY_DN31836_c0_g1_i1.p1  ORF type:complete len:428 (+),score=69.54 TRINITY_DN31836_c0_g1_i1:390-1673(+)